MKKIILLLSVVLCAGIAMAQSWGSGQAPDTKSWGSGQVPAPQVTNPEPETSKAEQKFCPKDFETALHEAMREVIELINQQNIGNRPIMAVMEFHAPDLDSEWRDWARDEMEDILRLQGSKTQLFERQKLDTIINELGMQLSDIQQSDLATIGKQTTAQYIMQGRLDRSPAGHRVRITAISVSDGKSFSATGRI
jgi:TolB-like protein